MRDCRAVYHALQISPGDSFTVLTDAWGCGSKEVSCNDADKENNEDEEGSWSEKFATALTTAYAAQQSAAAARCGVSPGEVWRAALEAASNVGTRQVLP